MSHRPALLTQAEREPDEDAPITLTEACELAFRNTLTVATLRAEAGRGNLAISKIGRRYYTTLRDVREMVGKCRVEREAQGSISTRSGAPGQSATAANSSARAALRQTVVELKKTSART
jgi:hypothetical protein